MSSPYNGLNVEDWKSKTEELIKAHPLKEKIVPIVLKAWDDIFNLSSTYKCNFLGADNKQ